MSYHVRLFLLMVSFSLVTAVCVVCFQYMREREYKIELLNSRLQAFNRDLITDSVNAKAQIGRYGFEDLRVTLIDSAGNIAYDNKTGKRKGMGNHLQRPEVVKAMQTGEGFTVRRHSKSTDGVYFYSATKVGDYVVRSAVPYSVSLSNILAADKGFLWFMALITAIMCVVAWFATRRIGHIVTRLNEFARRAEAGDTIYDEEAFPKDELGEISHHIVRLYAQKERQHEEALRQEREMIRMKKQLTNNINHELKTPLAAMQVCLETIMSHPELPDDKKQIFVSRCYENSERLRALLTDVSTLTRLDDGSAAIAKEPLVLNHVIDDAVRSFTSPDLLPIEEDVAPGLQISGNADLLSAIFCNLIRNSNAYSQGSKITIRAAMDSERKSVEIGFADDGIGIPAEHLPHIFERFYRVDKGRSRASGGTGLGLSIAKNAVAFHGGTITAFNQASGGLAFKIVLPADGQNRHTSSTTNLSRSDIPGSAVSL